MQVKFNNKFFDELNEIRNFIAKDSTNRAVKFVDEIMVKCYDLVIFPHSHRTSQKVKKPNARDLIYKGYVIPFLITDDEILILGIYKHNLWKP